MSERWTVEDYDSLVPGPDAAALLARVVPGRLCGAVLAAFVAAQQRQVSHEQARLMAGMAAVVDALDKPRFVNPPGPHYTGREEPRDLAADEIAAVLAWTKTAAGDRIDLAVACVNRLPGLHEAMLAGRVDYPKAMLFVTATSELSDVKARAVVDSVLDRAATRTTAQLRPMLARRVAKADPDAAHRRRDRSVRERGVHVYPDRDGTATLTGHGLPMHRAQQAFGRVHAIATARKDRGDDRGIDQIRADVYLDLLQGLPIPGPDGQDAQPPPPQRTSVELTAPVTTLLGLADDPGQYGSWGPILADAARDTLAQLAAAPWRLTATDNDGIAMASVAVRRRPTADDAAYVRARDRACRMPHCNRPATHCEIDHTDEVQHGGKTHACNLGPLCHRHHRLKTRGIWQITQIGNGQFHIRSPLGATHLVTPEPVDDLWDLPDDLWDWTDDAEWAEWWNVPQPEPPWAVHIDRPDEPEFRHDPDDYLVSR